MANAGYRRPADVGRVAEAAVCLTVASAIRRTLSTRHWQALLGVPVPVTSVSVASNRASGIEGGVGQAVARAVSRLPWQATCLDQALAAQLMLRRRHRPATTVIGLRPGTAGERWPAHAWLVGESGTIVGLNTDAVYAPVSGFRPSGLGRR